MFKMENPPGPGLFLASLIGAVVCFVIAGVHTANRHRDSEEAVPSALGCVFLIVGLALLLFAVAECTIPEVVHGG